MEKSDFLPVNTFVKALDLHRKGHLGQAETLYRGIIAQNSFHFDATQLLGVILAQTDRTEEGIKLYKRALKINPDSPEVLANLASALQSIGQTKDAILAYKKAISLKSDNAEILFNLGNLLNKTNALTEAINAYRSAVRLRPDDPDILNNLANSLRSNGQSDEAVETYQQALDLAPERSDILANQADALIALNNPAAALIATEKAVALDPDNADAWNNQGTALVRLGKHAEALQAFNKALELAPNDPRYIFNSANALSLLGLFEQAVTSFRQGLALDRHNAEAFNQLGSALQHLKRHKDAIAACTFALRNKPDFVEAQNRIAQSYLSLEDWTAAIDNAQKALDMDPNHAEALFNKGMALIGARRFAEGVAYFDKLLAISDDDNIALINLGNALLGAGKAQEALDAYLRMIEKMPNWSGGFLNLGHAYMNLFDFNTAIDTYKRGLVIEPGNPQLKYSIGNVNLHIGQYEQGWAGYEHRWQTPDGLKPLLSDVPVWAGENLAGKKLLIYGEQGLGDTLQMARYFSVLKQQGAEIVFKGYKILHSLLATSGAGVTFVEDIDGMTFDYQIAVMSLPFAAQTRVDTVPQNVPYLHARPDDILRWRQRIGESGFKIGINWQGSPLGMVDAGRSAPLRTFLPIALIPGVRLISMQKNHGLDQLTSLPDGMNVETLGDDFDAGSEAFMDTAAVIANMDLVITTDTSMAHVAGGLGAQVWVALKKLPDWRWMMDRSDSPWYPTMQLFRQQQTGVWDSVFQTMSEQLSASLVGKK